MGGLQIIETLKASGAESDFFARWAGFQARRRTSSSNWVSRRRFSWWFLLCYLPSIPPLFLPSVVYG